MNPSCHVFIAAPNIKIEMAIKKLLPLNYNKGQWALLDLNTTA